MQRIYIYIYGFGFFVGGGVCLFFEGGGRLLRCLICILSIFVFLCLY